MAAAITLMEAATQADSPTVLMCEKNLKLKL